MAWLSLPLLIGLHNTSLPLCTMPGTTPCSEPDFSQVLNHLILCLFKLWGKCMDEDGKTHVDTSKTIILPYTVWNYSHDSKVHGTTVCLCGSYTDFLCEPLALYWTECKFIIFHVFLYSFASCLCVIRVNIYVNVSYVHSADKCNYWLVVKTSW